MLMGLACGFSLPVTWLHAMVLTDGAAAGVNDLSLPIWFCSHNQEDKLLWNTLVINHCTQGALSGSHAESLVFGTAHLKMYSCPQIKN